jgi:hypothetical protein
MITQDELLVIKNTAIADTKNPTFDSWYRSICRWFSREFSTPLKTVLDYPYEFVLQNYYEEQFYKLANGSEEEKKIFEEVIEDAVRGSVLDEEAEQVYLEDDEWYKQDLANIDKEFDKNQVVEVNEEIPFEEFQDSDEF